MTFNLAEFKVEQTLQEGSIEDQSPRHLIKVTFIKFFARYDVWLKFTAKKKRKILLALEWKFVAKIQVEVHEDQKSTF